MKQFILVDNKTQDTIGMASEQQSLQSMIASGRGQWVKNTVSGILEYMVSLAHRGAGWSNVQEQRYRIVEIPMPE